MEDKKRLDILEKLARAEIKERHDEEFKVIKTFKAKKEWEKEFGRLVVVAKEVALKLFEAREIKNQARLIEIEMQKDRDLLWEEISKTVFSETKIDPKNKTLYKNPATGDIMVCERKSLFDKLFNK